MNQQAPQKSKSPSIAALWQNMQILNKAVEQFVMSCILQAIGNPGFYT